MAEESYYETLELEKTATEKEISKQYKKLAAKWHPDKNLNNKEKAEEMFKKISEAYEVLSDPQKRDIYDKYGKKGLQNGHHVDPEELFKQMFGQFSNQESEVPDLKCELELTFEQMYSGCKVTKEIERTSLCNTCFGSGTKDGITGKCKHCDGSGYKLAMLRPGMMMKAECNMCGGSGKKTDKNNECKKCHGMQFRKEFVEIEIDVPKGVFEEYPIVIEEEGYAILPEDVQREGRKRSKAVFFVKEVQHETFKRFIVKEKGRIDMADLAVELNINLGESIVGFSREIQHLNKEPLFISSSKPVRHGDILVLKKKGMPKINEENDFGDLFISINVQHPENINLQDKDKNSLCQIFNVTVPISFKNSSQITSYSNYIDEIKKYSESENIRQKYEKRRNGGNTRREFNINEGMNGGCSQQ
jgi:DnaJ-class molecular chaperone